MNTVHERRSLSASKQVTQGFFLVSRLATQSTDGLEGSLEGFQLVDCDPKGPIKGVLPVQVLT